MKMSKVSIRHTMVRAPCIIPDSPPVGLRYDFEWSATLRILLFIFLGTFAHGY